MGVCTPLLVTQSACPDTCIQLTWACAPLLLTQSPCPDMSLCSLSQHPQTFAVLGTGVLSQPAHAHASS
eukprot:7417065-Lingulodinium_polyedra.AAC.1